MFTTLQSQLQNPPSFEKSGKSKKVLIGGGWNLGYDEDGEDEISQDDKDDNESNDSSNSNSDPESNLSWREEEEHSINVPQSVKRTQSSPPLYGGFDGSSTKVLHPSTSPLP